MAGIEPGTIHIPTATPTTSTTTESTAATASGEDVKGKRPKLPSFWIPTLTPNAKPTEIKKPVRNYIHCMEKKVCAEQTKQTADSCFGLVGPHQRRVCLAALGGPRLRQT